MAETKITLFPVPHDSARRIATHPHWRWTIDHDGQALRSGMSPASGPTEFNTLDTAADNAVGNFGAVLTRARQQRHARLEQQAAPE